MINAKASMPLVLARNGDPFPDLVLGIIVGAAVIIGLIALAVVGWRNSRIRRRLGWHFSGLRYRQLPVVGRSVSALDLPNVRRAIEAYVEQVGGALEVLSVNAKPLQAADLAPAAAAYRQVDIDVDDHEDCLTNPLYLISAGEQRYAILLSGVYAYGVPQPALNVMAATRELAGECLDTLRRLMRQHSIYRGRVISIESQGNNDYDDHPGWGQVRFHRLPSVTGDAIILPESTMNMIQRNTVGFFRHAARLKQEGHSVKRGLLFHGPPGTGKTRTACWLTHSLQDVTVFLVTGEQLWNIKESCSLAKSLSPAMLILEDVDLIATRRDQSFQTTALHQLMNEMDGLDSDAEVLFLLTTNQPDQIEPALANRPGRIDQAIHFPLPDFDCRRRLIELYRGRSTLAIEDWESVLRKTEGASPAFIKELVRKAALLAVEEIEDDSAPTVLADRHFLAALHEMTSGDGELTRRLAGFAPRG